jgi:hypothetical protein
MDPDTVRVLKLLDDVTQNLKTEVSRPSPRTRMELTRAGFGNAWRTAACTLPGLG